MKSNILYFSFILILHHLLASVRTTTTRKTQSTTKRLSSTQRPYSTTSKLSSSTSKYHSISTPKTCIAKSYVESWTKENFPNPQTSINYDSCGRNCKKSWVCDPGHILKTFQADTLDKIVEDIKSSKQCGCPFSCRDGYSVSIGLVPEVKIEPWEPALVLEKRVAEFTNYLRSTKWNFGACDNDVVIFVSRNQRRLHISTGPVVRKVLTNDCVNTIHNNTSKYFKQGMFYEGLVFMMNRFGEVFKYGTCHPPKSENGEIGSTIGAIAGVVVFLTIVLVVIIGVRKRKFKHHGSGYQPPAMHHHPHRSSTDSNDGFTETNTADGGGGGGGGF